MDGLEVLRQIKTDTRTSKIPVVVLTSSHQDQNLDQCYALGANSYIVKPLDPERFIAATSGLGLYWLQLNQIPPVRTEVSGRLE